MKQQDLFKPVPRHKLASLTQEELIEFIEVQGRVIDAFTKENIRLKSQNNELEQKSLYVDDQYITLKNKFFGKSSEKEPSLKDRLKHEQGRSKKNRRRKVQLPSLRYPNAPLVEREVELKEFPICKCCNNKMSDSGMTENSEHITVIPKQHWVIRQKRHIYRCTKCHGDMVTAPVPPRIKPGSSYSDEMIIDVAMSKYCDLIPIERYASIAGREGLSDLPPQSLIEQTHYLADFVEGAYDRIRSDILLGKVLHADETPHRMLEENDNKSWYLWGFSTKSSSYYDVKDTRSGDVAHELLKNSSCEYLVSDVFSGYSRAIRLTNEHRDQTNCGPPIKNVYCNAHARRKFKEAKANFPDEAQYFIDIYKKIYRLEKIAQARPPDRVLRVRRYMVKLFEDMKTQAMELTGGYSTKSSIGKAISYYLKNYEQFILFVNIKELPIDNNPQERLLRNPVIGRKTWLGTHSKRGAKTNAILFSLVESCKLNKINPREYIKKLVEDLHRGKDPYTPKDYTDLQK